MLDNLPIHYRLWHYGKAAADKDAYIYNSETGKYDIIGFILCRLGISPSDMDKKRLVSQVAHNVLQRGRNFKPPYDFLCTASHADTDAAFELARLNDDPILKDGEREELITRFLSNYSIVPTFTASDTMIAQTVQKKSAHPPISNLEERIAEIARQRRERLSDVEQLAEQLVEENFDDFDDSDSPSGDTDDEL